MRLPWIVLAVLGALGLSIYFSRLLRRTIQSGVVSTTHGGIDRRTKPCQFWLFVGWLIALILVLIVFIPTALLVALGALPD